MLPGRAYLGKWQHAKDAEMIKTLGITHILNISDSCANYLEGSHCKCDIDEVIVYCFSLQLI